MDFTQKLENILKQNEKFCDTEGELLKQKVKSFALLFDEDLIKLLLNDEDTKEHFFKQINEATIFDYRKFIDFIDDKNFLLDSYTKFSNKIGLTISDKHIKQIDDVVLTFPFKDCILEGGQSKEDENRKEIFFNETLAKDEISRLLDKKVITNAKKYYYDNGAVQETEDFTFTRDKEINKARGLSEDTITDNLIIKGNNLLALHSIKSNFAGKVKLIYIDPPYNTGNDSFKYNDSFNHSSWLTFMKNRLEIARDLLSDDGVIFVQCDDNEQAYLKVLMDDIFGHNNFISNIAVKAKSSAGASGGGEDKKLKKNYENILIFSQREFTGFNKIYEEEYLEDIILQKSREKKNYEYNKILFNSGRKKEETTITLGNGSEIVVYKHYNYEIDTIKSICKKENLTQYEAYKQYFKQIFRTQDAQSSIRHKVVNATKKSGELYSINYIPSSGKNKGKMTELFYYKNEMVNFLTNVAIQDKGNIIKKTIIGTLWKDIGWDGIANEGGVKLKFGKKPEKLLHRIISMATNKNDIVLDFHLGSGTTCAVAHKMKRQYIGIEQMNYIENLAVKRLKNVIDNEQSGISKDVNWKGGGEFIYFELDKYNQKFIDELSVATEDNILDIYKEIAEKGFLNYDVELQKIEQHFEEFKALSLKDKKEFLISILNKNMLYKNLSDIDDSEYEVDSKTKSINADFYNLKKEQ